MFQKLLYENYFILKAAVAINKKKVSESCWKQCKRVWMPPLSAFHHYIFQWLEAAFRNSFVIGLFEF
jgi:hypothetical protein